MAHKTDRYTRDTEKSFRRVKNKEIGKIYQVNGKEKKAGVVILISVKAVFKSKSVTYNK